MALLCSLSHGNYHVRYSILRAWACSRASDVALEEEREERIQMEISVDAYGPEEQALGWYTYLADTLHFPFTAHCVARRAISPLDREMNLTSWEWLQKKNAGTRCLL